MVVVGLATLLIATIGFSRIYLRIHFASDVLAGLATGLAWLMVCVLAARLVRLLRAPGATGRGPSRKRAPPPAD